MFVLNSENQEDGEHSAELWCILQLLLLLSIKHFLSLTDESFEVNILNSDEIKF